MLRQSLAVVVGWIFDQWVGGSRGCWECEDSRMQKTFVRFDCRILFWNIRFTISEALRVEHFQYSR